jgi:very-short-patch-repair endonuclease
VDPVAALRAHGGAARTAALRRAGVSSRPLAAAVAAGVVVQHAAGLYSLPGCAREQLARAALDGRLSCLDAARAHGLSVLRPDPRVHVQTAHGSRRTWPGTVAHRLGPSGAASRGAAPAPVALGLVATLRSAARCAPPATAVSLVDEALRTERCTLEELLASCTARDPGWRGVLAAADARAMSGIESYARVELVEALRELDLTVEVQVALRGVGAVDLLVDGWLVIEVDGFAFHADRDSYREDRRRNQVLSCHGHVWLRFTYEDVVRSRGRLAARVLETWARGRPPGFRSLRVT